MSNDSHHQGIIPSKTGSSFSSASTRSSSRLVPPQPQFNDFGAGGTPSRNAPPIRQANVLRGVNSPAATMYRHDATYEGSNGGGLMYRGSSDDGDHGGHSANLLDSQVTTAMLEYERREAGGGDNGDNGRHTTHIFATRPLTRRPFGDSESGKDTLLPKSITALRKDIPSDLGQKCPTLDVGDVFQVQILQLRIVRQVGQGAYANVYECSVLNADGHFQNVALKVAKVSWMRAEHVAKLQNERYEREVNFLKRACSTKHVITLLDHVPVSTIDRDYPFLQYPHDILEEERIVENARCRYYPIVTELGHGNLQNILDAYLAQRKSGLGIFSGGTVPPASLWDSDPDMTLSWIHQTMTAVAELHSLSIIHTDLKPDNFVMVDGDVIKIIDLGVAVESAHWFIPQTSTWQDLASVDRAYGARYYQAPELAPRGRNPPPGIICTPQLDIWSLGVIFCEWIYGCGWFGSVRAPFVAWSQNATDDASRQGLFSTFIAKEYEMGQNTPEGLQKLMDACLFVDPSKRPTAKYLVGWFEAVARQGERAAES